MHSGLKSAHPAAGMLYFVSVLAFSMQFFHPVLLGLSFCGALLYSLRLRGRATGRLFGRVLLPTLLFVTLINTAFDHYGITTLFTLPGGNRITLETLVYGFVTGAMVVTVFLWFTCYNEIITTDKFLFLFGRILPTGALLMSMTLRFIPLFYRRLQDVHRAQRGIGAVQRGRLRSAMRTLSILITWSLENAVEISDSMKSRGYGLRGRTSYSRYVWTARDMALSLLLAAIDAVVIAAIAAGRTRAIYDPYIAMPRVTGLSVALFVCYALLCLLPAGADFVEELQWNRLRSK